MRARLAAAVLACMFGGAGSVLAQAAVSIGDVFVAEGGPGTTSVAVFEVTVDLSVIGRPRAPVTLTLSTRDGTATAADGDYQPLTDFSLTVDDSLTATYPVPVTINGDAKVEANESFFLDITDGGGVFVSNGTGQGTIGNDDQATVSINDVAVAEGDAGTTDAVFTVSLSALSDFDVVLSVDTRDGTATVAGGDYQTASAPSFIIPAGTMSQPFVVRVNGDGDIETDETFFVDLIGDEGVIIGDGTGQGTIQNDDVPSLSIDDVTAVEGDAGSVDAVFAVSLSAASPLPVTVDFVTSDGSATAGSDYQATAGAISFAPGELSQPLLVSVNGDDVVETDETFFVGLSSPVGATIADGEGQGTIQDDDMTGLSIDDVTVVEGDAGTVDAVFTVTLTQPSDSPVTVEVATRDGTATVAGGDYQATAQTLTFPALSTTQSFAVPVVGDTVVESDESFFVDLANAVGAAIADGEGEGTIQDDDMTGLSVDDVTLVEGDAGTVDAIFTVTLAQPSDSPVTVDAATRDGTATVAGGDYQATAQTLTFPALSTTQSFAVPVVGDRVVEVDESFFVELANAVGAPIADGEGRATIEDDDVARLSIAGVTVLEGDAGTVDAVFAVALSRPSALPVTVRVETFDATATVADGDYQATAATLTFAPGSTSEIFAVPVNGDQVVEPDERFRASLSDPDGAILGDAHAGATIRNDDEALSVIRFGSPLAPTAGEAAGGVAITVGRTGGAAGAAAVTVAVAGGTATAGEDFRPLSRRLTWAAGEGGARTVELRLLDDDVEEDDETVIVELSSVVGGSLGDPRRLVVTISDDDEATLLEPVGETARTAQVDGALEVQVRAAREDGAPVQGASVLWSVIEGDAELLGENPSSTDGAGLAAQSIRLGGTPGAVTVQAEIPETGQVVTFTIRVEGDLDELFDPLRNPAEAALATALNDGCNQASPQFAELCDYLFGLDPDEQRRLIGELTPTEAAILADLLLQSPTAQLLNLRRHLASRRGGGSGGELSVGLTGQSVPLEVLRQAFAGEVEVVRRMATRIDAAMFQRQEEASEPAPAPVEEAGSRINVFASGRVDIGERPGTQLEAGYDLDTLGLTLGFDYQLRPRLILGGALGYVDTDTDVHGNGGGIDMHGYSLSGFVTYFRDRFWLDGILSYGRNDYDFVRHIELPQPFQGQSQLSARGQPGGSQLALDFGGGYDAAIGAANLSGFGRLSYIEAELDGFTEEGAGPFSLTLQSQKIESLLAEAGFEATWAVSRSWGVLQPMLRGSVLHEFADDSRTVIARFAADPGDNPFRLPTDSPDRDFYRLGAGVTVTLARGRGLYLLYETDLARDDLDLSRLTAGMRLEF